MKAFIYVRVSTTGQVEDGVSLEAQEARARAYCLAQELEVAGVFVDAGISGKRADNRPGLQQALAAVCAHHAALVTYSLSRLARSTRDALDISARLDKAGADLVSLSEKIDTTSAAGKMVFRMLAVLAEFERDQVSERTRAAMSHLRTQGMRISGRIPYGFDLDPATGALTPNPAEQEAVTLIRDRRSRGESYREIIEALVERGIETKGGGRWYASTIKAILDREAA